MILLLYVDNLITNQRIKTRFSFYESKNVFPKSDFRKSTFAVLHKMDS